MFHEYIITPRNAFRKYPGFHNHSGSRHMNVNFNSILHFTSLYTNQALDSDESITTHRNASAEPLVVIIIGLHATLEFRFAPHRGT